MKHFTDKLSIWNAPVNKHILSVTTVADHLNINLANQILLSPIMVSTDFRQYYQK